MLDSYIIWNGINSKDLGLIIKKEPNFNKPKRKFESYKVAGRNGDYIVLDDAWENITQEYTLFIDMNEIEISLPEQCHKIAEWLYADMYDSESNDGYFVLRDSYDTDKFRYASLIDEIDIENHLMMFGSVRVRFYCRPEYFLDSGTQSILLQSNSNVIENPTKYIARPQLYIELRQTQLSDDKTFSINHNGQDTQVVTLEKGFTTRTTIDSFNLTVSNFELGSRYFSTNDKDFPYLSKGTNTITFDRSDSYGIYRITVYPNWWVL